MTGPAIILGAAVYLSGALLVFLDQLDIRAMRDSGVLYARILSSLRPQWGSSHRLAGVAGAIQAGGISLSITISLVVYFRDAIPVSLWPWSGVLAVWPPILVGWLAAKFSKKGTNSHSS